MKKPIVAAYWGGGQAIAKVTKSELRETKIYGWKYEEPIEQKGELFGYAAIWDERTDGGEFKTVKRILSKTLQAMESSRLQLIIEYEAANPFRAKYLKAIASSSAMEAELLKVKPPPGGIQIWNCDFKDYDEARATLLRISYPNVFACFDAIRGAKTEAQKNKQRENLERAYLLDVAKLTGAMGSDTIPADSAFIVKLAQAVSTSKRTRAKADEMIMLRTEVLRGWFSERYCFMSNAERATAINKRLKSRFGAEKIRNVIRGLNIGSKRSDGPPESGSW